MNTIVPERMSQARELAGLTKSQIAEALDVSAAAITQWENGSRKPTSLNLEGFARQTGVKVSAFTLPVRPELRLKGPLTFRAQQSTRTSRQRAQAESFAEMCAEVYLWVERWVRLPAYDLPELDQAHLTDIEAAAQTCRRHWGLGDKPIMKLGELMESKGVRMCQTNLDEIKVDGFSCTMGERAFIYLSSYTRDRARARFSTAHELGHLVLHHHHSDAELLDLGIEAEAQANAFASAFLMPAATFSHDVVDTSLNGFLRLKQKWGVAVQAMVRRARDLKLITQDTYERHYRTMSAKGWRRAKGEPLDETVPAVNRTVGSQCLQLISSQGDSEASLMDELPFPEYIFTSVFGSLPSKAEAPNVIRVLDFRSGA
ncbi:MAG: ImmA/IrrE family metallo-endopeptidase [Verrucomicrobia bacterium]|nr:ImmA/IrrE family metallo-endopeptidase [Verrucomicrobiota bacterium]